MMSVAIRSRRGTQTPETRSTLITEIRPKVGATSWIVDRSKLVVILTLGHRFPATEGTELVPALWKLMSVIAPLHVAPPCYNELVDKKSSTGKRPSYEDGELRDPSIKKMQKQGRLTRKGFSALLRKAIPQHRAS